MNYRLLGRTGLKVSAFCLGTMQFGWTADPQSAFAILDEAMALGCNFIDTADIYSRWAANSYPGRSEEIIGQWLEQWPGRRADLIIATKVRGQMGDVITSQGLSRHHIMNAVHDSLSRLQTDYIDLYQLHWPDEETPLDETLSALTDLVRSGKVRMVGCSNFPAWLLTKALWVSDVRQLVRFETVQPHYNLAHRAEFERELLPLCLDQQIGVIPYSPLAGGFLTGKYRRDQDMPDSPRAARIIERYCNDQGYEIVDTLTRIAQVHEKTVSQIALAWLLARSAVSAAIIGANTVAQLQETVAGVDILLTDEQKRRLDQASAWQ